MEALALTWCICGAALAPGSHAQWMGSRANSFNVNANSFANPINNYGGRYVPRFPQSPHARWICHLQC